MTGPALLSPPSQAAPAPGAPLLPPRPNTGPVPWSEEAPAGGVGPFLIGALLVVLMLGFAVVLWRRRRHRQPAAPAPPEPADLAALDPSSRHLAAAEILRAALASRHGPTYRARTTEELLADPSLLALLGPDRLPLLGSILSSADRLKFAGPSSAPDDDGPSAELVETLRSALLGSWPPVEVEKSPGKD